MKNMSIVLILGGFHTMMSYCGSIGTLMEGSGLAEAHKTCYGDVIVKHIASGKAISKALRAHFLTEAAIMTLLMTPFSPHSKDIETYQEKTTEKECEEIQPFDECAEMDETAVLDQEITDIGEADVLNQESGRDWVAALVLQSEATLRPLTNDEIYIIMELCNKLESDFSDKLDILEQSKEVNLLKQMLSDLKES